MYPLVSIVTLASLAICNVQNSTKTSPFVPEIVNKFGGAAITRNNRAGIAFQATLPKSNTTNIGGYVVGFASGNGTGIVFTVNLYGFPSETLGSFLYHIHEEPVPSDSNCSRTLGHLDSYARGESPPCDPSTPQNCQVGDLAGKHGNVTSSTFRQSYLDLYVSNQAGQVSFFGNRSLVIHTSNTTRLACANFTLMAEVEPTGSGTSVTPTVVNPNGARGGNSTSAADSIPTSNITYGGNSSGSTSLSNVTAGSGSPPAPTVTKISSSTLTKQIGWLTVLAGLLAYIV